MSFKSVDKLENKINSLDSIDDINKKTKKYNDCKKKIESVKETLEEFTDKISNPNDYQTKTSLKDLPKFIEKMDKETDLKKMVDNYVILHHHLKSLEEKTNINLN